MAHIVHIDLDETSAMIRENLDLALPHVTAQAHVNPVSALKTVTAQWSYADLILRNLDPKYVLEVERFTALRAEARGLIKRFWETYALFPIERANGHVAQAQVVEPTKPTIRHVKHKKHAKRVHLTDEQKREIVAYFDQLGRRATDEDYTFIMETYGMSANAIKHVRFDERRRLKGESQ